ncbi:META domain-containing protein [Paraburkholderia tagetis]|uniref:META domain-containing protein n=1 Tax=Paraburkholderia tagetis TaxID=2913261 RepID=A0A9X1UIT0_9BURK|nr:META domain-containing protein [Paraburkholderia tagetis]MCG5075788.1 META domain-containing protein [Paraburkholderia tagetis]
MPHRSSTRPAARNIARLLASRVSCAAPLAAAAATALLLAACKLPVHQDTSAPPPDPFNPAATQLLDNTQWQLVEWKRADGTLRAVPGANTNGAASAPAGTPNARPITLDLSTANGQRRASGFSGCNRYMGTYSLKNGLLSFGQLAGTRMACIGSGGAIEGPYLDALAHIQRSGVQMREPQTLLLILENGDRLTFAATGSSAATGAPAGAPAAVSAAAPAKQGE